MLTMAFWKRRSGTFEPSTFGSKHKYGAYYLGKMETDGESGLDCTLKTVNNMYKNYKQSKGKNAERMAVEITREGLMMHGEGPASPRAEPNANNTLLPVVDISFGTAVPGHDKVFAVVVRGESSSSCTWYCHGFLCDSASIARDLTLLLVKAFQRASAAGEISHPMSVDEASKQSKPTTLHILHERGRLEHQRRLQRSKSLPAVSTIRVTLNVEYRRLREPRPEPPKPKSKGKKDYVDGNKEFAEALAKRDREKDKLKFVDKPDTTKKRESGGTGDSRSPLRRSKSDSGDVFKKEKASIAAEKENLDTSISSESEKDSISDNSSTPNGSDIDSEQEIVVAINPLMSILKNPSSPLRAGGTTTVAFRARGGISSPRSDSDDDEEGSSDLPKDGSGEDKMAKRAKRKSVRFSEDFAVIP